MSKAVTTKNLFSRETSIKIDINSDSKTIWNILTNASNYPKWNSTIISLEGQIKLGLEIKLISYLDPKRIFKLKIKEFIPEIKLVWGDSMGQREYILTPIEKNKTTFSMTERIGGPLFPIFSKMIPSFDESFEKFANDIKKASEI